MATTPDDSEARRLEERIRDLVEAGDVASLADAVAEMHPSDVADILEGLDEEAKRLALVDALPSEVASEALAEMEEGEDRGDLLAALDPGRGAQLLHELQDDDAADLIAELEPHSARAILARLPVDEAGELRGLLQYGEETAGGRMTTDLVSIVDTLTAGETIARVRRQGRAVEDFYTVFVVDERDRLVGQVPLDELILADPSLPVREITEPVPVTIHPDLDQEEVGRVLSRYNLVSVPVVDDRDHLLGRITFDDVIDVIEAEQTEDILRLAGVSDEEEIRGDWGDAVRTRLPWLSLNLITAALAASVIFLFEDLLSDVWYLAGIMPIIAAMGGNSGTQALAVTVRLIALGEGPLERKRQVVGKELVVGLVNGIVLGLLAAGVAQVLVMAGSGLNPMLPVVVLFAMWGTIIVSAFAGAFIPTVLDRFGIDPAVASSVFVTTLTDLFGFFLLLGLASALVL